MANMLDRIWRRLALALGVAIQRLQPAIAQATLPRFGNTPAEAHIDLPRRLLNPEQIFLGDHLWLGPGTFLYPLTRYPTAALQRPGAPLPETRYAGRIVIGQRVTATGGLQISAAREVVIEDDVMFASNVFVTDHQHGYATAEVAYKFQPLTEPAPTRIGRGSWIGQNAVILPGVTIGEHAIIGANSVVTRSVPARCMAAGAPARVVKHWSAEAQAWVAGPPETGGPLPAE